jgi:RNA polymerase sigma factor (sigma-70 family)
MSELPTIVTRAQAGDLSAYEEIVRQFQDMAVGYAYSLLGDFQLAEDAAQEAFLQTYTDLSHLNEPAAFPGWFRKVVYKHCDRFRRKKRLPLSSLDSAGEVPSGEPSPEEHLGMKERREQVIAAIQTLPEKERTVITLYYISDFSQKEVAAFLEVPVSTVGYRLHAARKKLKERMLSMVEDAFNEHAPSRDDSFVNRTGINNAAQAGDVERVRQILAAQPDLVNSMHPVHTDRRPIHFAARNGHADVVRVLLEYGADPVQGAFPNRETSSPLFIARDRGYTDVVEMIEQWLHEQRGSTPAGEAFCRLVASSDSSEVLAALDTDPALINATDTNGATPLHHAVLRQAPSLVIDLIDRGADIDYRSTNEARPIHHALRRPRAGPEVKPGQLASSAIIAGILLARGAENDIWVASALGDRDRMEALLVEDTSAANSFCGPTFSFQSYAHPLTIAAQNGDVEAARLLLDNGADPNVTRERSDFVEIGAPLWFAAKNSDMEMAELLIERGADVNTKLYAFSPAVSNLDGNKSEEMLSLLYRHGATQSIGEYASCGNVAVVVEMLQEHPDQAPQALHSAMFGGHVDIIEIALRHNPDLTEENWFEVLYFAMSYFNKRHLKAIQAILLHGVSPNVRGRENHTLLQRVSIDILRIPDEERLSLACLLVEAGADLDARDDELQSTALGWAACYGRKNLVEYFLERGASLHLPDDKPWATPLARAERQGHVEVAEILRRHGAKQ